MPTYLYVCEQDPNNPIEFEELHSISTKLDDCPVCKEKNLPSHAPKRLINSTTPGKVELYGSELTQQIKKEAADLKRQTYSSEKHYANIIGENKYQNIQTSMDRRRR